MNRFLLSSAALLFACGLAYIGVVRPHQREARQIRTLVELRWYAWHLDKALEDVGRYPATLRDLVDGRPDLVPLREVGMDPWGNRLFYWSDAESYRLVSFSLGGEADRDYGADLPVLGSQPNGYCDDYRADQVFSSGKEVRACGKD